MDDVKTSSLPEPPRRSGLRREREAEALRANLRKRKDQQRAREVSDPRETPTLDGQSPDEER